MGLYIHQFDPTARATSNLELNEEHLLSDNTALIIVPKCGLFYTKSMIIKSVINNTTLFLNEDYTFQGFDAEITALTGYECAAAINFKNTALSGMVSLTYQAVGGKEGEASSFVDELRQIIAAMLADNVTWSEVVNKPQRYPTELHTHNILTDLTGLASIRVVMEKIYNGLASNRVPLLSGKSITERIDRLLALLTMQRRDINTLSRRVNSIPPNATFPDYFSRSDALIAADVGGSPDVITADFDPPFEVHKDGIILSVLSLDSNLSHTPTFTPNVDLLLPNIIQKYGTDGILEDLEINDITPAMWMQLQYNVTDENWVLLNPASNMAKDLIKTINSDITQIDNFTENSKLSIITFNTFNVPSLHSISFDKFSIIMGEYISNNIESIFGWIPERISNKVSDIVAYKTDSAKYPNTKAVYDHVETVVNNLELGTAAQHNTDFFLTVDNLEPLVVATINGMNITVDAGILAAAVDTAITAKNFGTAAYKAVSYFATPNSVSSSISEAIAALTKADIGLFNVDNTSDIDKPVSTATSIAISASLSSITKASIGLGNVDNTADLDKPVSDLTSTAITNSLNIAKSYADGLVVGLLDDRGSYDASLNTYPTTGGSGISGAINKGDIWFISVEGTLNSKLCVIGSSIRALIDNPGQTDSNWDIIGTSFTYVPENINNKINDLTISPTDTNKYPNNNAVTTYINGLNLQTVSNLSLSISANPTSDTLYPSNKAVVDYIVSAISGMGGGDVTTSQLNTSLANTLSAAESYTDSAIATVQSWVTDLLSFKQNSNELSFPINYQYAGTTPIIIGSFKLKAGTYAAPTADIGCGDVTYSATLELRKTDGTVLSTIGGIIGGMAWHTGNNGFTLSNTTIIEMFLSSNDNTKTAFIHGFSI